MWFCSKPFEHRRQRFTGRGSVIYEQPIAEPPLSFRGNGPIGMVRSDQKSLVWPAYRCGRANPSWAFWASKKTNSFRPSTSAKMQLPAGNNASICCSEMN